ncbi:NADP-dependent oxidoreductase [Catelliglobosispora koreensis]|uniref:NADP-dependent oxidoreductase n=1 Tax=Catelliglobosispora koreensis TaxID=129052 RepID=UPI00039F5CB8|nr:NADP-dependent oxidoreductase [Catelliglobosispora koreensis]
MTTTMRQISQQAYGGPDVLQLTEVPLPEPGLTEIRVKVSAAGVNPADWKTRRGDWDVFAPPFALGWDVSGIVDAVAPGVTRFRPGDEVYGMPRFPQLPGGYGEYVTAPARHFARKPANLSHEEAAALPLVSLTAWQALADTANLQPHQRVLIHAAAGGVGHVAVQIAKARGAYVIGTARQAKHAWLRDLGAGELIDYTTTDFAEAVSDVDVVLDTIGGDYAQRSLRTLRPGGVFVTIVDHFGLEALRAPGIRVEGLLVEPDGTGLEAVTDLAEKGLLKPYLAKVFPLEQAAEAHRLGETDRTQGKIVLKVT